MAWVALTKQHVKDRISENEIFIIESIGGGDENRLEGILKQVTSMVRSKVAGCDNNTVLGPLGTIPDECIHAAATIAKHDIRASLPSTGSEDEGDLRKEEYRSAMSYLNQVSRCEIGIQNENGQIGGRNSGCFGGDPKLCF